MPSLETINYILTVLGGVLLVLLGIILVQIIQLLKKANKMATKAENAVENVEYFVAKPMKIAMQVAEQVHHIVNMLQHKGSKKAADDDEV
ncbi:MAG: hypothetical protein HY817_04690 [Candidatus Abawacabacteria bacterium]|nr:hypothetical protein [Candidatus Abawacabacteria bacterium]